MDEIMTKVKSDSNWKLKCTVDHKIHNKVWISDSCSGLKIKIIDQILAKAFQSVYTCIYIFWYYYYFIYLQWIIYLFIYFLI
jgi:hypothetical protein